MLIGGSAILTEAWRDRVSALLLAWYGGIEGGHGLASVLTGGCGARRTAAVCAADGRRASATAGSTPAVVQDYAADITIHRPVAQLLGFRKVTLRAGATTTVRVTLVAAL